MTLAWWVVGSSVEIARAITRKYRCPRDNIRQGSQQEVFSVPERILNSNGSMYITQDASACMLHLVHSCSPPPFRYHPAPRVCVLHQRPKSTFFRHFYRVSFDPDQALLLIHIHPMRSSLYTKCFDRCGLELIWRVQRFPDQTPASIPYTAATSPTKPCSEHS